MTAAERGAFAELLIGLGETYGEPVSDARMEIYWRALKDLPLSAVHQAADLHVRSQKFFPRPAELREAFDGRHEDRAELAWDAVRALVRRYGWVGVDGQGRTPDFPDEATRRAAMELYGGWAALCQKMPNEGPELLGVRKAFIASFSAYARETARLALPMGKEDAAALLGERVRDIRRRTLPEPVK